MPAEAFSYRYQNRHSFDANHTGNIDAGLLAKGIPQEVTTSNLVQQVVTYVYIQTRLWLLAVIHCQS